MKTWITLVRHGVTDWNNQGRAQGHADISLNREGLLQAECVAQRLSGQHWDALYSSPLQRTMATAGAIARATGLTIQTEERLKERNVGAAEGTTESERAVRWPGQGLHALPGVEKNEELTERAVAALTAIAERHAGQRVLCVSHGGLIVTLLRSLVPEDRHPTFVYAQRNTAVTPLCYEDGHLVQIGDADWSHLLIDGVEYSGEVIRLAHEGARSGLVGLSLPPAEADALVRSALAVESAWVGNRLVGWACAAAAGEGRAQIGAEYWPPDLPHVGHHLRERLQQRVPGLISPEATERPGA